MLSIEEYREKLGETGKNMSDEEVETQKNNLYALISRILDNNVSLLELCKKQ